MKKICLCILCSAFFMIGCEHTTRPSVVVESPTRGQQVEHKSPSQGGSMSSPVVNNGMSRGVDVNANGMSSGSDLNSQSMNENGSQQVSKCVVQMKKSNGVYYIPLKINGMELDAIFDTGASSVVISTLEAMLLVKQEKIKQEDIIGDSYYITADGSIGAGAEINLGTVQIGDRIIRDVRATVVDNIEADLLVGQTVLSRFSKIGINYDNESITFFY